MTVSDNYVEEGWLMTQIRRGLWYLDIAIHSTNHSVRRSSEFHSENLARDIWTFWFRFVRLIHCRKGQYIYYKQCIKQEC